ncbi:MAG: dihydrofolate reductase family protein [Actinobacteria bacterium]|nr:dihydrofolate reductase family protein [Actinomycetota bacterium]
MGKVRFNVSMSLDGYMAGPHQSERDPLGLGGLDLHSWLFALERRQDADGEEGGIVNASTRVARELESGYGAVVMGRNMFGPIRGPWNVEWRGWWGEDPPWHTPVYVLTHHQREPLEMDGGTTFYFVTDGIASALERARASAGEEDVLIGGGASVIQQYLASGLIDEFWVSIVPILLGSGERLFDNVGSSITLELIEVVEAPEVTHLKVAVK